MTSSFHLVPVTFLRFNAKMLALFSAKEMTQIVANWSCKNKQRNITGPIVKRKKDEDEQITNVDSVLFHLRWLQKRHKYFTPNSGISFSDWCSFSGYLQSLLHACSPRAVLSTNDIFSKRNEVLKAHFWNKNFGYIPSYFSENTPELSESCGVQI